MTASPSKQAVPKSLTSSSSSNRRAFAKHVPKWQRFQSTLLKPTASVKESVALEASQVYPYQRQYSHVYSSRLSLLKSKCWAALNCAEFKRVRRVLELREGVKSTIVGTLVKEECNDFDSFFDSSKKSELLHPDSKCKSSDQLYLEDESGRVTLSFANGAGALHDFCTGIVMGIQGSVDDHGVFTVKNLVFPSPPPAPATTITNDNHDDNNDAVPHLLLVSGMNCGEPHVSSLPREMLLSYLLGHFTTSAKQVCRVIVAGGCVGGDSSTSDAVADGLFGIREFDGWAYRLVQAGLPIDVIPSQSDPTTVNWPQRPLHSSLLRHSGNSNLLFRSTNPYAATHHGSKHVICTDGLNVKDVCAHVLTKATATSKSTDKDNDDECEEEESLEPISELTALQKTLQWSHVCPTGPSSVPTVPHADMDPMVITETPHIYVAGNMSKFSTSIYNNTRLICVPKFSQTGEAVLVNLETLGVQLLRFENNAEE